MDRRTFILAASGLFLPREEHARAYSFVGGWRAGSYPVLPAFNWDDIIIGDVRIDRTVDLLATRTIRMTTQVYVVPLRAIELAFAPT